MINNKKLLMIAIDFPPCKSPGVQRTLQFSRYLYNNNWNPIILTAYPFIYDSIDPSTELRPLNDRNIYRAFGLNVHKHLSLFGKHLDIFTKPDIYSTWYYHSVIKGRSIIKKQIPDAIWSTHPCLTSHKIAEKLKNISGLPWIADYRDPFKGLYNEKSNNLPGEIIDRNTILKADVVVFATKEMKNLYKKSYPQVDSSKFIVIENGYNNDFFDKEMNFNITNKSNENSFNIIHSGELYEYGRNPFDLFKALHSFNTNKGNDISIKIIFRGLHNIEYYMKMAEQCGASEYTEFLDPVSYIDSVKEMCNANALLILQGEEFNVQIPGKTYDYLRSKKPILALTPKEGATGSLLSTVDHVCTADIDDVDDIISQLRIITKVTVNRSFDYKKYSREERSKQLLALLDNIVD